MTETRPEVLTPDDDTLALAFEVRRLRGEVAELFNVRTVQPTPAPRPGRRWLIAAWLLLWLAEDTTAAVLGGVLTNGHTPGWLAGLAAGSILVVMVAEVLVAWQAGVYAALFRWFRRLTATNRAEERL